MTILKDLLVNYIGAYTPIDSATGAGSIDWAWIMSAVLLIVLIYCAFGLLRKFIEGWFK